MAKKPIKEEVINNYPADDLIKMNNIFRKAVADGQTIGEIYHFYKKYINANAPFPLTNCNCQLSVGTYFTTLRDFCSINGHKFS